MMSLAAMPSSIATRVRRGRDATASLRASRAERRERIDSSVPRPQGRTHRRRGQVLPRTERQLAHMKLGVHVGYWGLGLSSQDQIEIVKEAERLGYDSGRPAEGHGSDAATILGWLAAQT